MADRTIKFTTKNKDLANEPSFTGQYLRNFKEGETKVRFLEESPEWETFHEHYTRDRKSFPCTGNTMLCPGCQSEDEQVQRRTRKSATFVYLPEPNIVLPYRIPISLGNKMSARAERNNGSITNRDYVVIRSGQGLSTEYDVDADEKYPLDVNSLIKKAPGDINEILRDMFEQIWGDITQFMEKEKDYEPSGMDEFAPKEEDEVTESQLRKMSRGELEKVWLSLTGENADEDWSKAELLTAILKKAE